MIRTAFLVLVLSLLPRSAFAEAAQFLGKVVGKVACTADLTQSYALYLPSDYTAEKKWPIIFCFDPRARGIVPVERLRAAAEKFGWIVVGSNNSRNGPWSDNAVAMRAVLQDAETHLAMDPQRIYAAGMSGGARVATQLGLSGRIRGVIGCSAGFPVMPDGVPRKVPFIFFGTAGTTDFNYREMQRLENELEVRHVTHRIVFFEGSHEWASAELLAEAIEWMEIQAMRAGVRRKDDAMIQASLKSRLAALDSKPAGPAWAELKSIVADFRGLSETLDLERKLKSLDSSREVSAWQRAERNRAHREDDLATTMNDVVESGSVNAIRAFAADLRRAADAPDDSPDRQMAQRMIAGVVSWSRESGRASIEDRNYGEAVSWLELTVALRPLQSHAWFDLARAYALDGDKKQALRALQEAAKAGYSDAAHAEAEPAFAKLRREGVSQQALAAMRANPAEPARSSRERP